MKKLDKPVYVTQPDLPDLKDFTKYLENIWDSKWLTNNGVYHIEFENRLAEFLGIKYVSLFTNGTLALITALQALRITGEVITTPYSFVASTHALHWNGIKPVFCDVDDKYGNIDANKIETLISPNTTAILPVHVYGNPVNMKTIQEIADTYGLKVIYDAAHAFGVKLNNESILNFGDLSVLSFHATKAFNTIEGGAIICHDKKTKQRIDFLKNFGFADEVTVVGAGINAKMNEIQSAFGLLQLDAFDKNVEQRKMISDTYRKSLGKLKGIRIMDDMKDVKHNYSYFPIFIEKDYPISRDELYEKLKKYNIFGRRYFYPLISSFSTYKRLPSANPKNLPIANKLANEVICLPIYPNIDLKAVELTCEIIHG